MYFINPFPCGGSSPLNFAANFSTVAEDKASEQVDTMAAWLALGVIPFILVMIDGNTVSNLSFRTLLVFGSWPRLANSRNAVDPYACQLSFSLGSKYLFIE